MDYAITFRIGRWMITNGDLCQGRRLRLYREEMNGPGTATCRWVAVFPKLPEPPPLRPLTKEQRDAETKHIIGKITTEELQRIRPHRIGNTQHQTTK